MGKIYDRIKAKQCTLPTKPVSRVVYGNRLNHNPMEDRQVKQRPDPSKKKGYYQGLCNVRACQSPHRVEYWNKWTDAFYCHDCARAINGSNAQFKDCDNGEPFVLFKTAEEAKELYVRYQP